MVVGPEFVSTSPVFLRTSASHPACPHDPLASKGYGNGAGVSKQFVQKSAITAVTAPPLVGCVD